MKTRPQKKNEESKTIPFIVEYIIFTGVTASHCQPSSLQLKFKLPFTQQAQPKPVLPYGLLLTPCGLGPLSRDLCTP